MGLVMGVDFRGDFNGLGRVFGGAGRGGGMDPSPFGGRAGVNWCRLIIMRRQGRRGR
jgi:hypothetical protein